MTILVSTYREEDLPLEAHCCGAAGYLHKSDFGGQALGALWNARPPMNALPGRESPPSHAYEQPSPTQDRA
jgi:hypothetical protein